MPNPIKIAVHGAAGRMGQRLVVLGSADDELQIAAALDSPKHPKLGEDIGHIARLHKLNVPLAAELTVPVDVIIDFSNPAGAMSILKTCLEKKIALVVATTGLDAQQLAAIEEASKKIPLLSSPSMSLTVNLAMRLAEICGRALAEHPSGADVEIIERHHRFKEDAPSGTALKFGQIIADAMGLTKHQHGREGRPGQRPHEEIGYHAVRSGDNPGEHTIIFGLLGETLEIKVQATNRDCYAHGALAAAKFLAGKPAGLYGMNDVLGL
ncbi:MAG TPA: 4-hydroxy-tetrahydrodipicolinate reductase [Pirellulales bacterium]|jgi:4-hydroxy-tetrahydrodipicolinate reductase|nr:4-hydroxy-tetrahydrodipicolinate reductase [Pirellulales bacterium]